MESPVSPSPSLQLQPQPRLQLHQRLAASSFVPSLPPPPGVTSNPDDPASLRGLANVTIAISVPVVTIFFLLRVYARIFIKRAWILEDVLVSVSWAGTVAYCAVMRATMSHHGGEHAWDMTASEAHEAAYWFNVGSIEYGVIICMTKLAVLCLYRRVFSPTRWSGFDKMCVGLIVVVVGFYLSTSVAKIWQCSPRDKIWNPSVPGTCLNLQLILNVSGAFNMVTDYLILLIPVQAVCRLRLDRMRRVMIIMAFTFGLCAPVFATVGFIVRLRNSGNPDMTWKQPEILLWGAGELVSGNLSVCFPELAVLFRSSEARARFLNKSDAGPHDREASSSPLPHGDAHGGWQKAKSRSSRRPASLPLIAKNAVGASVSGHRDNDSDDRSDVELRDREQDGAGVAAMAKKHAAV